MRAQRHRRHHTRTEVLSSFVYSAPQPLRWHCSLPSARSGTAAGSSASAAPACTANGTSSGRLACGRPSISPARDKAASSMTASTALVAGLQSAARTVCVRGTNAYHQRVWDRARVGLSRNDTPPPAVAARVPSRRAASGQRPLPARGTTFQCAPRRARTSASAARAARLGSRRPAGRAAPWREYIQREEAGEAGSLSPSRSFVWHNTKLRAVGVRVWVDCPPGLAH